MAEWASFQADLAAADTVMRALAWKYEMKLRINIRDEWPSRELVSKRWTRSFALRLMLNPEYPNDKSRHYELHEQLMKRSLFGERLLQHHVQKRYTADGVHDIDTLVEDLERLISNSGFVALRRT